MLAPRSLALRPAHSRRHRYVTGYTEGFSHFVTSMTAPVASGWSVRRVGLAPTGKRRLVTAHANSGHSQFDFCRVRLTLFEEVGSLRVALSQTGQVEARGLCSPAAFYGCRRTRGSP